MPESPTLQADPGDLARVQEILRRLAPGVAIWAFGSRVQGRARLYSDLDLALVDDRPTAVERLDALRRAFSESDLPWRVDVVDFASAPASLQEIIARRHVVLQAPP